MAGQAQETQDMPGTANVLASTNVDPSAAPNAK
jgi:hypothetical protein